MSVFGTVCPDWKLLSGSLDLAALENGGTAISWSNAHYGNPMAMLQKARSVGMHDGWETARNPTRPSVYLRDDHGQLIIPGNEWAIIRLGSPGLVSSIIVDTAHYKGNYPESFLLLGTNTTNLEDDCEWIPVIPRQKLTANSEHRYQCNFVPLTHVKLVMYPDGGISRLRVIGEQIVL